MATALRPPITWNVLKAQGAAWAAEQPQVAPCRRPWRASLKTRTLPFPLIPFPSPSSKAAADRPWARAAQGLVGMYARRVRVGGAWRAWRAWVAWPHARCAASLALREKVLRAGLPWAWAAARPRLARAMHAWALRVTRPAAWVRRRALVRWRSRYPLHPLAPPGTP